MKQLIFASVFVLMGCSSQQGRGDGVTDVAAKMAEDKRKIDSFKNVRQQDFGTSGFTVKKEAAISDSIIRLQIEYDSLAKASK